MSERERAAEAVRKLEALEAGDPERSHLEADDIVLEYLPRDVREAYQRVITRERGRWWFA